MSTTILAVFAIIFIVIFRILNVHSTPAKPKIYCKDSNFKDKILKITSELNEFYQPTRLWGFSGHVQTILQSLIGRVKCPLPLGERVYISMQDNSTLTYDLYQGLNAQSPDDDITIAICPGVGNSSESVYIRTFVHYAQCHGYRISVLNHIGVIDSIKVTSHRIFSYGHTEDFSAMIDSLVTKYPTTRVILIGFSLGGNLVCKYLGESTLKPQNIMGAVSICQGYDACNASACLLKWANFQRFYFYILTENVKSIIMKHRNVLLSDDIKRRFNLNEREIAKAATLIELDAAYTCKIHNFSSPTEMYKWSSCINYLHNIDKPIVFINSLDDPLVPEDLLNPIRKFAETHPRCLYIETQHGGHLGFYEGGKINPNPLTYLDRLLVGLLGGLAYYHDDKAMKQQSSSFAM